MSRGELTQDKVVNGMKEMAAKVEENEPDCLSYGVFTGEGGEVIIFERYCSDT
jgi:hypothetical protein